MTFFGELIMKRMAIISAGFVPVPAVDGGAGEVQTTEIINSNEKEGDYFIDIYTIESPKLDDIEFKNAEIIPLHISRINWFMCKVRNAFLKLLKRRYRFIPYNRSLLRKFRDNYDFIVIENNMQVFEDIYNHSKNNSQMIYHMHNDIDGTTKPEYLCKFIAEKAYKIIFVSEYLKKHFNEVAPNNKSFVLNNCIELDYFNKNRIDNQFSQREEYKIEQNDFIFMYTGRICKEKGIYELVQSFKMIEKDCPNAKLMIVGSVWYNQIHKDDYSEKIEEDIKKLDKKVIITGYIYPEKMPQIYSIADVVVIPTLIEEAFGMSALEGMAMDLPVIVTNSGGMEDLCQGIGENIIVKKEDHLIENLAEAMKKVYFNKLSNESYYSVKEHIEKYDIKYYFNNFKAIIDK